MPLADANVLLFTNPVITLALGFFVRVHDFEFSRVSLDRHLTPCGCRFFTRNSRLWTASR